MKKRSFIFVVLLLISLVVFGCDTKDSGSSSGGVTPPVTTEMLPVLFVHGTSGSATQFQSQAQRFMANGYPVEYLAAFEYDSSWFSEVFSDTTALSARLYDAAFQAGINAAIDDLLAATGKEQINLIGHSLGTFVCNAFLKTGSNAQRVAHYISIDGTTGLGTGTPWGGVRTLALWGMGNDDQTALGTTATNDHDGTQSHIEICTSSTSFGKIYEFFHEEAPATTSVPDKTGDTVIIAGKANLFPENTGASGRTLYIYELNSATGMRISAAPINTGGTAIGTDGSWGPFTVDKGVAYEFYLEHGTESTATQVFYMEPFYADNYFIRLHTGEPGEGMANDLTRSASHANLMIARDREMWGDQGVGVDDVLLVNGSDVLDDSADTDAVGVAAAQDRRLSSLFLSDQDSGADTDMTIISAVTQVSFLAGVDFYIAATSTLAGGLL